MSIILPKQNLPKIADLLEALLAETLFSVLPSEQVQGIRDHMAWLRLNKGIIICQANLATDTRSQATIISFMLRPQ